MTGRATRAVLRAGTQAHYVDPTFYDRSYMRRRNDVAFYVELARSLAGPVLELGVGTGRVAIAIARAGIEVVGVDRMRPMLEQAARKLERESRATRSRVTLVRGDLERIRLGRRFPLVISPFHVLMHLYSRAQWERALATVHAHLAPRGRFAFDVLLPDARCLARDPDHVYRLPDVLVPSLGRRVKYRESFDYDAVSQVLMVHMQYLDPTTPAGSAERAWIAPLTHRQLFPEELAMLLHYNGFDVLERFGTFEREPLAHGSPQQVLICRARTAPRRRAPRRA